MQTIRQILFGECLADIAVNKYGNLEGLFELAYTNGLELDATPVAGSNVVLPELVLSKAVSTKLIPIKNPLRKVLYGECLADIAMNKYGNLEGLFDTALANGLGLDATPVAGSEVKLEELVFNKPTVFTRAKKAALMVALPCQAVIDLALQESGSFEAVFEAALLNGLTMSDELAAGSAYQKAGMIDKTTVTFFSGKHKPASNTIVPYSQFPEALDGIDYWIIEDTFIVS